MSFARSVQRSSISPENGNSEPREPTPAVRSRALPSVIGKDSLSASELGRFGAVLREAESGGLPWKVSAEEKATAKHLPSERYRRTVYPRVVTAAVELLLLTGCRLSEVLSLRWEQVDLAARTILLPNTKAGRPQTVAINAPARKVLLALLPDDIKANPWVLPNRSRKITAVQELDEARGSGRQSRQSSDGPRKKDAMEAAWQKIRAVANLNDVHLHDLRHTVGTYAGQSGANAFLVRDLLRHSDLSMTHRYVNKADDPVRTLNNLVGERIAASLHGPADVVRIDTGIEIESQKG